MAKVWSFYLSFYQYTDNKLLKLRSPFVFSSKEHAQEFVSFLLLVLFETRNMDEATCSYAMKSTLAVGDTAKFCIAVGVVMRSGRRRNAVESSVVFRNKLEAEDICLWLGCHLPSGSQFAVHKKTPKDY